MNTFSNVSSELRAFFSTNRIFKILLPIDMVLLFAGLIILFLINILGIGLGGFFSALGYWAFILGLLLTYANMKEQFLYIGLFGYGAINILDFLISLIGKYHIFSWANLFNAAIFGGLGYLVLKRTLSGSAGASING